MKTSLEPFVFNKVKRGKQQQTLTVSVSGSVFSTSSMISGKNTYLVVHVFTLKDECGKYSSYQTYHYGKFLYWRSFYVNFTMVYMKTVNLVKKAENTVSAKVSATRLSPS